jgi:hypothetical protein
VFVFIVVNFRKFLVEVYLSLWLSYCVVRILVDKVRDQVSVLEDVSNFSTDASTHLRSQHIGIPAL